MTEGVIGMGGVKGIQNPVCPREIEIIETIHGGIRSIGTFRIGV